MSEYSDAYPGEVGEMLSFYHQSNPGDNGIFPEDVRSNLISYRVEHSPHAGQSPQVTKRPPLQITGWMDG